MDPADAILGLPETPDNVVRPVNGGLDRAGVFAVQTPQVFAADLLRNAYANASTGNPAYAYTDDASRVAALGHRVYLVEGDRQLVKLTHRDDAETLAALLTHRRSQAAQTRASKALLSDEDDD